MSACVEGYGYSKSLHASRTLIIGTGANTVGFNFGFSVSERGLLAFSQFPALLSTLTGTLLIF